MSTQRRFGFDLRQKRKPLWEIWIICGGHERRHERPGLFACCANQPELMQRDRKTRGPGRGTKVSQSTKTKYIKCDRHSKWQTQTLIVNQPLNGLKKPDIYAIFNHKAGFQTSPLWRHGSFNDILYRSNWLTCKPRIHCMDRIRTSKTGSSSTIIHVIFSNSVYLYSPFSQITNLSQSALQSVHRHPWPLTSHRIRNNSQITLQWGKSEETFRREQRRIPLQDGQVY